MLLFSGVTEMTRPRRLAVPEKISFSEARLTSFMAISFVVHASAGVYLKALPPPCSRAIVRDIPSRESGRAMMKPRAWFSLSVAMGVGACVAVAWAAPPAAPAAAEKPATNVGSVAVTNPSAFARARETVVVPGAELAKLASFELKKALVVDGGGRPVL